MKRVSRLCDSVIERGSARGGAEGSVSYVGDRQCGSVQSSERSRRWKEEKKMIKRRERQRTLWKKERT